MSRVNEVYQCVHFKTLRLNIAHLLSVGITHKKIESMTMRLTIVLVMRAQSKILKSHKYCSACIIVLALSIQDVRVLPLL